MLSCFVAWLGDSMELLLLRDRVCGPSTELLRDLVASAPTRGLRFGWLSVPPGLQKEPVRFFLSLFSLAQQADQTQGRIVLGGLTTALRRDLAIFSPRLFLRGNLQVHRRASTPHRAVWLLRKTRTPSAFFFQIAGRRVHTEVSAAEGIHTPPDLHGRPQLPGRPTSCRANVNVGGHAQPNRDEPA
jgi:hypothetical protein